MARKKEGVNLREHSYLAIMLVLIVFLFMFAFFSPVNLNGEITGGQVINFSGDNLGFTFFSLLLLLFAIMFLILFTYNLMSKVI